MWDVVSERARQADATTERLMRRAGLLLCSALAIFAAERAHAQPAASGHATLATPLAGALQAAASSDYAFAEKALLAIQGADQPFSGCLNPVRVRLVRQDGALTEKQGCRGFGWTRTASEKVNTFLSAYY